MGLDPLPAARAWLAEDPDPATAAQLADLIARGESGDPTALAELVDAFAGPLRFGTAGLRGPLGPGPNRMNRAVVLRAAAGLAAYLRSTGGTSVLVGHDARHGSADFARDTARVMAGAGLEAMVLPRPLPTPVTAFGVRYLGTDAGVMVTASHNPAADNGYKVYLGDGRQITAPTDAEISAAIDAVGPLGTIPLSEDYITLDDGILDAYIDRAASLLRPGPRDLTVAYTALHGVGAECFRRCVAAAGFAAPHCVAEQIDPDPDFPTVAFPNPEEPGALDLVIAAAARIDADLVIAQDPDADRLAVAVPDDGSYRPLTGDELGALLGWWIVERRAAAGLAPAGTIAQSIVSGTLLEGVARAAGYAHATTLTGFKWISRVPDLVFGYEEALGYCVDPEAVADKDGSTAALLAMECAAALRARGRTLLDALDDLERAHGVHATAQVSVRASGPTALHDALARIQAAPPTSVAGHAVLAVDDLARGDGGLPPTPGIRLLLDDARIIVRPSGTEPKLKCYLQVVVPADRSAADLDAARHAARESIADLGEAMRALLSG